MWVNNLVSEGAAGEVGALWDVEDLLDGRLGQNATLGWPQLTEDTEEGRLSTAVGTRDQQVHALLNLEVHLGDQLVAVRAVDGDVFENDVVSILNRGTLSGLLVSLKILALVVVLVGGGVGSDHDALILTLAQIGEYLLHLVDESGVTGQVLNLLVGHDQSTDSLGKIDQQRRVANVVLSDLGLVIAELGKVLGRVGAKDG